MTEDRENFEHKLVPDFRDMAALTILQGYIISMNPRPDMYRRYCVESFAMADEFMKVRRQ